MKNKERKPGSGGARTGAGRPTVKEKRTITMRVTQKEKKIITDHRKKKTKN